jgi:enterochelin esterase-like enzyme
MKLRRLIHASLLAFGLLAGNEIAVSADSEVAPPGFADARDVPHGKLTTLEYDSKSIGFKRKLVVYTPPDFNPNKKYPVLYLLHGSGDDETGWTQKGSANVILDNLFADKKATPTIVAMPYGFTNAPGTPTRNPSATPEERQKAAGAFERDLLTDVIPFMDSHFRTIADREHRALAGLSMGGGQTMRIGPLHSDTFAYLGVFSAGLGGRRGPEPGRPDATASYPDAETLNANLKLFWVSCGDKDPGLAGAKKLDEVLTEKKIKHVWHEDTGAHEWPVWKNDLYLFAQRLFH